VLLFAVASFPLKKKFYVFYQGNSHYESGREQALKMKNWRKLPFSTYLSELIQIVGYLGVGVVLGW
jgi:hypothetical protein